MARPHNLIKALNQWKPQNKHNNVPHMLEFVDKVKKWNSQKLG